MCHGRVRWETSPISFGRVISPCVIGVLRGGMTHPPSLATWTMATSGWFLWTLAELSSGHLMQGIPNLSWETMGTSINGWCSIDMLPSLAMGHHRAMHRKIELFRPCAIFQFAVKRFTHHFSHLSCHLGAFPIFRQTPNIHYPLVKSVSFDS